MQDIELNLRFLELRQSEWLDSK